jgi:hypothetical protein
LSADRVRERVRTVAALASSHLVNAEGGRIMVKSRLAVGATLGVVLVGSSTVAFGQSTSLNAGVAVRDMRTGLSLEIVGQVQNSAPGVSPAASIQYGYVSYLRGLPIFTGQPSESTALLTFYTDTTTTQVINDGPMRVIDRKGTLTIYKDSAANGNFADANTFRDGTPTLVASLQQQVILDTSTNAFTARNLNTVTSTRPFEGAAKLGEIGDQFTTVISGHLNTSGAPSAYMAGYTVP